MLFAHQRHQRGAGADDVHLAHKEEVGEGYGDGNAISGRKKKNSHSIVKSA